MNVTRRDSDKVRADQLAAVLGAAVTLRSALPTRGSAEHSMEGIP
jgi:hypothetical protein